MKTLLIIGLAVLALLVTVAVYLKISISKTMKIKDIASMIASFGFFAGDDSEVSEEQRLDSE